MTNEGKRAFPFQYPFGKVLRLSGDAEVTIGEVVTVKLHPSGPRFDGPAVVVSAFNSPTPSVGPVVEVVALADASHRLVCRRYSDVLPARPPRQPL